MTCTTKDVTQSEFAVRTGLSRQRISSLVANGTLPKTASGKIPWTDGLRALIASLGKTAAGRGESPLSIARTRLADAQRESIEQKSAVARGEYLLKTVVTDRWDQAASTIQIRVMGAITEIAQALHLTRHQTETVDRLIRDALTQAADEIDGLGPMEGEGG
jgi:phage terminase Nu1 subunit (DNA packaging protein)